MGFLGESALKVTSPGGRTHGAAPYVLGWGAWLWIEFLNCDLLLAGLPFFLSIGEGTRSLWRLVRGRFLTSVVDCEDRDKRRNTAGFQNE